MMHFKWYSDNHPTLPQEEKKKKVKKIKAAHKKMETSEKPRKDNNAVSCRMR